MTTPELEDQFASFGPEVRGDSVPALVEAGYTVWSWGYGDEADTFTTLDKSDLWLFYEKPEDAIAAWGPFRLDHTELTDAIKEGLVR